MKKIQMFAVVFLLLFTLQASAQFSLNVSLNSRPSYHNHYYHYENNVDYYYLPEIEAYFDNRNGFFIYYSSNGWTRSEFLPSYCRGYNIDNGVKIVLDYHGRYPYSDFHYHKVKYCRPQKRHHDFDDDDRNYKNKCHKNKHYKNKRDRDHDDDD